jgi:hypothetical protein
MISHIKNAKEGRIINVSSGLHKMAILNLNDIESTKFYEEFIVYA